MRGWRRTRLGDCCRIVSGATPRTSIPEYWDGDILWATPKDLSELSGPYIAETQRKITRAGLDSCAAEILPPGSVLFSSRAPIGHVAINTVPMATNQGIKSLIPDPEQVDPKFLYYWLRRNRPYLESLGRGATFKEISKEVMTEVEIHLPPLDQQRRIAEVLERAENLIVLRHEALNTLGQLTSSVFVTLFGNPVANDRGWPMVRVGDAGRVQLGRQRAPKYQTGRFTRPYIRVANVYEDRIDLSDVLSMDFDDADFAAYRLEYGDILLNEGQSTELVGRPAMWRNELPDCCFQNTLIRFQADRNKVVPEFALGVFLFYFRHGEFAKVSSKTSNVAHLGAGRLAAMPFPLPPLSLQQEFARRVEVIEKLKAAQRASLTQLEALYASLQDRAFKGEL